MPRSLGSLLERKAVALKQAGLSRITVSLDSMNDAVFRAIGPEAPCDGALGLEVGEQGHMQPVVLGEGLVAPGAVDIAVAFIGCPETWISSPTCVLNWSLSPCRV